MRRALLIAVACALACAAPSAAAQPGWTSPHHLGTAAQAWDYPQYTNALAVTADGAAVAVWDRQGSGMALSVRQPGSDAIATEDLPGSAEVAADGLGNAYLAYRKNPAGDVGFRVRPSGGTFGAEEVLPLGTEYVAPQVVASRDGDVALVWEDGGLWAAIRPRDGSFGAPQYLGNFSVGYWMAAFDAALSANGDLVLSGATFTDSSPGRVFTIARRASGEVDTNILSDGARHVGSPSVAIDDGGRAIVVWPELGPNRDTREVFTAQRSPGGGFGARTRLHRTRSGPAGTSAAMSHDGRYTLSAPVRMGRRVYTGRAGEPPQRMRSYYDTGGYAHAPLAASPGGDRVLLTLFPSQTTPLSAMRTGDGPFDPAQDVRRDCGGASTVFPGVGENGQTAALMVDQGHGVWLTVGADVAEQRTCYPTDQWNPNPYFDDPYAPSAQGGPGGGTWEDGPPPSGGPPAPPPGSMLLGMPSLRAASSGTTFPSRVVVVCGKPCKVSASVTLRFDLKGDVLGRAKTKRSVSGKPTVLEIPIKLTSASARRVRQAMRKRGKRALLLQFEVTATGKKLAKSTRTATTVVGP